MKHTQKTPLRSISLLMILLVILISMTAGCTPTGPATQPATEVEPVVEENSSLDFAGKKILWVDSYHEGYAWTDGIESGLHEILDGTGVELKIIHMDTKRNSDEAFVQAASSKARAEIEAFKPDVVIASEDTVQKSLIVPFYKGADLPIIFIGVNWDASAYGYPTSNVTGMLEVELPDQVVNLLKANAKGEKLGYITIDTETERKSVDIINNTFFAGQMQIYWATNQDEFKAAYITAQQEVDILLIGNNAGTDTWNEAEMKQFVLENTSIPTGAVRDWMAPYAILTVAKSAKETGIWAAQTALSILGGTPVSEIPVTQNKKGELIINLDLADKLDIIFAPSLLKNAVILGE